MSKELYFTDGNNEVKYLDTTASFNLAITQDGSAFDLTNATAIDVKVANDTGYVFDKSIDMATIKQPLAGLITMPVDAEVMNALVPDDYTIEVWVTLSSLITPGSQEGLTDTSTDSSTTDNNTSAADETTYNAIFPSDDPQGFTITENVMSDSGDVIPVMSLDAFQQEFEQLKTDLTNQVSTLQGPAGKDGENGKDGATGPQGPQGIQGPKGDTGQGLDIKGKVDTTSQLPSTASEGDGYLVAEELYIWTNNAWKDCGQIQGPKGDTGPQGPAGKDGTQVDVSNYATKDQLATKADDSNVVHLDDLLGGRNYLTNTAKPNTSNPIQLFGEVASIAGNVDYSTGGVKLTTATSGETYYRFNGVNRRMPLQAGQTYTLSYTMSGTAGIYLATRILYAEDTVPTWEGLPISYHASTTKSMNYKDTFTIPDTALSLVVSVQIYADTNKNSDNTGTNYVEFSNVMLEKGEVQHDWVPAPEDLGNSGDSNVDPSVLLGAIPITSTTDLFTLDPGTYFGNNVVPVNGPAINSLPATNYFWVKLETTKANASIKKLTWTDNGNHHYTNYYYGAPAKWHDWQVPNSTTMASKADVTTAITAATANMPSSTDVNPLIQGVVHDGTDLNNELQPGTFFSPSKVVNGPGFYNQGYGDQMITWTVSRVISGTTSVYTQNAYNQVGDVGVRNFVSGAGWGSWKIISVDTGWQQLVSKNNSSSSFTSDSYYRIINNVLYLHGTITVNSTSDGHYNLWNVPTGYAISSMAGIQLVYPTSTSYNNWISLSSDGLTVYEQSIGNSTEFSFTVPLDKA